eukprot:15364642-Ditylum_brightwellii.AAC.2
MQHERTSGSDCKRNIQSCRTTRMKRKATTRIRKPERMTMTLRVLKEKGRGRQQMNAICLTTSTSGDIARTIPVQKSTTAHITKMYGQNTMQRK